LQFGPQDDEIKPIQAKLDGGTVPTAGRAAAEPLMAVAACSGKVTSIAW